MFAAFKSFLSSFLRKQKGWRNRNPDRSNTETYGLARDASSQLQYLISPEVAWPHNKLVYFLYLNTRQTILEVTQS